MDPRRPVSVTLQFPTKQGTSQDPLH